MSAALQFIAEFTELHEKAKKGVLTGIERSRYADARAQFQRFTLIAQQVGQAGSTLRSPLRMAKMLKAELRPDQGSPEKTSTLDLSLAGFAVLLPSAMRAGAGAGFTLHLPAAGAGTSAISGRCTVASSRPHMRAFKVTFKFETLAPDAQEPLEMALIDAALERFRRGP